MIKDYLSRVKSNINIYTNKKTLRLLDGTYKSIYKGKSLDFDDLREYVVGDNIKDIDWKSSARSGDILIRRYIAEKKHNFLFVLDSGEKMLADTVSGESKKNIAIITTGILSYIANNHGDYTSSLFYSNNGLDNVPFNSSPLNVEKILSSYEKNISIENQISINDMLNHVIKNIKKRMIIFVITDLAGMDSVTENTLKQISILNDLMFINISDAYMTGNVAYDIDKRSYIPKAILTNNKLFELEKNKRNEIITSCNKRFKKYGVSGITISKENEIVTNIIDLLERHKNANIN